MDSVGVYDQINTAFQDIIAPELHAIRGDIRALDQRIVGLDQKLDGVDARLGAKISARDEKVDGLDDRVITRIDSLRNELVSEIRRLDATIELEDRAAACDRPSGASLATAPRCTGSGVTC